MKRASVPAALFIVAGCMTPPAAPPPPRPAADIAAPVGKTWDAVIDEFAAQNIPIRTMERASGFIAADQLTVPRQSQEKHADCGTDIGVALWPDRATYNVLVRGDSARSTVKVTVRWTTFGLVANNTTPIECSTTGLWEARAEGAIRDRAEGRAATAGSAGAVQPTAEDCAKQDAVRIEGQNLRVEVYSPGKNACVPHRCQYVNKAASMTAEAAIAQCRVSAVEARKEP